MYLTKLDSGPKKWMLTYSMGDKIKTLKFGAFGYEDYTIHKDKERKDRYITRHQSRENWTASGWRTAGFWSRWLLWNKPSISASVKDIRERFGFTLVVYNK